MLTEAREGQATIEYGLTPDQFQGDITQATIGPQTGTYDRTLSINENALTNSEINAIAVTVEGI